MLSPSGSRVFTVQVAEVSELGPPVWRPKASLRVYRGFKEPAGLTKKKKGTPAMRVLGALPNQRLEGPHEAHPRIQEPGAGRPRCWTKGSSRDLWQKRAVCPFVQTAALAILDMPSLERSRAAAPATQPVAPRRASPARRHCLPTRSSVRRRGHRNSPHRIRRALQHKQSRKLVPAKPSGSGSCRTPRCFRAHCPAGSAPEARGTETSVSKRKGAAKHPCLCQGPKRRPLQATHGGRLHLQLPPRVLGGVFKVCWGILNGDAPGRCLAPDSLQRNCPCFAWTYKALLKPFQNHPVRHQRAYEALQGSGEDPAGPNASDEVRQLGCRAPCGTQAAGAAANAFTEGPDSRTDTPTLT